MDLKDGANTAEATRRLVQSAVEGNFNMLRVWGGGIWEHRAFFDAADELGVLLYTDMQFTWAFILGTPQEQAEIEYQVKRLSHHPSIAMWDGCK
jgi:beta-mannosidase